MDLKNTAEPQDVIQLDVVFCVGGSFMTIGNWNQRPCQGRRKNKKNNGYGIFEVEFRSKTLGDFLKYAHL